MSWVHPRHVFESELSAPPPWAGPNSLAKPGDEPTSTRPPQFAFEGRDLSAPRLPRTASDIESGAKRLPMRSFIRSMYSWGVGPNLHNSLHALAPCERLASYGRVTVGGIRWKLGAAKRKTRPSAPERHSFSVSGQARPVMVFSRAWLGKSSRLLRPGAAIYDFLIATSRY
jgi:hypothetical protein